MAQGGASNQLVGHVTSVTGNVSSLCVTKDLDVEENPVQVGDPVYAFEVMHTGPNASIEVQFSNGEKWYMGPQERAEMDPEVLAGEQEPDAQLVAADGEPVDPNLLEPTAAGGAPLNDDGTSLVIVERGTESDPYQAFDTPGYATTGEGNVLDIGDVIAPEETIVIAQTDPGRPEGEPREFVLDSAGALRGGGFLFAKTASAGGLLTVFDPVDPFGGGGGKGDPIEA